MKNRLCTFSGDGDLSCFEKIKNAGYSGVIFFEEQRETIENAKKVNLNIYTESGLYDGIYTENIDGYGKSKNYNKPIIISVSKFSDYVKIDTENLPCGTVIVLPFEFGQNIVREGTCVEAKYGAVAAVEPSDKLLEAIGELRAKGLKVYVRTYLSGKSDEFATVPYIPAMMQWMLRKQSCDELNCDGFVESGIYGFTYSPVSEYITRLYNTNESGGACLAKLAGEKYGINAQKMIMAFKYASDGANFILPEKADVTGPFAFSAAYPLTLKEIYGFDFEKSDVTLQIDTLLKAKENFEKAASTSLGIDGEIENICKFIACTLETACNAKKWYRRLYYMKKENQSVRKKFLMEQMVNIAKKELANAQKCAEVIFAMPQLAFNNYESLCGISAIEAKIRLTEAAIGELKIKIQQM